MLAKRPLLKSWRKSFQRSEVKLCNRCSALGLYDLLDIPQVSRDLQYFLDQHEKSAGIVADIYLAPQKLAISLGTPSSWATEFCGLCVLFDQVKFDNLPPTPGSPVWTGGKEFSLYTFDSYSSSNGTVKVHETALAVCSAPPTLADYARLPLVVPQNRLRSSSREPSFRALRSQVDPALLRGWMSSCQRYHPQQECSTWRDRRSMPKYLIDVATRRVLTDVPPANYVALSYVWGKPPDNDTMPKFDFASAKLPDRLPPTLEDAINLTKMLGYEYLWADKYCINQQDSEEKFRELASMHRIYADSVVTIVDLAGSHDRTGLAGLTRTRPTSKLVSVKDFDLMVIPAEPRSQVWTSTWTTRGWTYQEGIFARRKIFLGAEEASFICTSTSLRESWEMPDKIQDSARFELRPNKLANSTFGSPRPMLSPESQYWQNVLEYCTKNLTYDDDALNAFRGLLTMYCQDPPVFFQLYGIPVYRPQEHDPFKCLARGLSWIPVPKNGPLSKRERRSQFPSWSWLGWKDSVITRLCSPDTTDNFRSFIDGAMLGINSFNPDGSVEVVYDALSDGDESLPRNLNYWTLAQSKRLTHYLMLDAPVVTISLATASMSPMSIDESSEHIFLTLNNDGIKTSFPAMVTNITQYFDTNETLAVVLGAHQFENTEYWQGIVDANLLQYWAGTYRAVYLMYLSENVEDGTVNHAGTSVVAMRSHHYDRFQRGLIPRRFLLR